MATCAKCGTTKLTEQPCPKCSAREYTSDRPWRVKDYADGWIHYRSEAGARESEEAQNGALVEPAPDAMHSRNRRFRSA